MRFSKELIKQIDQFCSNDQKVNKIDDIYDLYQQECAKPGLSKKSFYLKHKLSKSKLDTIIKNKESRNLKVSKYDLVKESTFNDFVKMRSEGKEVHYWHLQRSSRLKSSELKLNKRCSSLSFINSIKKKYKIVGRKVTVKRKANIDEDQLQKNSAEFVSKINEIVKFNQIPQTRVFNADQTGLNYEVTAQRTLEIKNTKHVHSIVKKNFGTTHSYTLQIYINQAVFLGKTLYIILREPKGIGKVMKKRFDDVLRICTNVKVVSSTSGHINENLISDWMQLFKNENDIDNKSPLNLLIWDDFSLQRSKAYEIKGLQSNQGFKTEKLPPNTTKYCQPLDTRFNLQYKKFYRTLFNDLKFLIDVDKYWIIKINSIVYNQLCSSAFNDLVKYCWKVAGYENDGLDKCFSFKSVIEMCFRDLNKCSRCDNQSVMKCSYCNEELCFKHLILEDVHLHF